MHFRSFSKDAIPSPPSLVPPSQDIHRITHRRLSRSTLNLARFPLILYLRTPARANIPFRTLLPMILGITLHILPVSRNLADSDSRSHHKQLRRRSRVSLSPHRLACRRSHSRSSTPANRHMRILNPRRISIRNTWREGGLVTPREQAKDTFTLSNRLQLA